MHFYLLVAAFCHHNVSPHGFIYLYIFLHINLFGKGVCQQLDNGHKFKSRDALAEEYGYSSRNVARYLRINSLIRPFKNLVDDNRIALLAAVDVSYLSEEEQETVYKVISAMGVKLKPKMAEELRKHGGELTEDMTESLIEAMTVRKPSPDDGTRVKVPDSICEKYFSGMNTVQMAEVVAQALEAWFSRKEAAYVQQ